METTADLELGDVVAPRGGGLHRDHLHAGPQLRAGAQPRPRRLPAGADQRRRPGPRRRPCGCGVRDAEGPIAAARRAARRPRRGPDDGAHRPRPGHRPGRDAAGRGAAARRHRRRGRGRRRASARRARVPAVQVLAAQQWLATPAAAGAGDARRARHAQPPGGHRAGRRGRRRCSSERTGSGALDGLRRTARSGSTRSSRRSPRRCTRRGIRYSEPPASWADLGQQVRTPGEVLTGRVGTSLDTVVVLAAALEQAGIRPLLWLAGRRGDDAFLGYWREERSAESAATTDAVAAGEPGRPRADRPGRDDAAHRARASPAPTCTGRPTPRWLTGELDRILGVIDVHRARRDGIVPLPARARDADGVLQVVEYRPAVHSAPARPSRTAPPRRRTGPRRRRACSSGRTRCSTSACATG